MDTTRTYDDADANPNSARTTLAAAFSDKDRARDAIHRLHDEGYRDTWLGITRADESADYAGTATEETRVEADNWFARFFGEGDESLHDALVRHGVSEADARTAGALPGNSAIITVDGANHPELAAQIISENGGQLITRGFGSTGYGTEGSYTGTFASATATGRTAADVTPAAGTYAAGSTPLAATGSQADTAYNFASESAPPAGGSLATDVPLTAADKYAGISSADTTSTASDFTGSAAARDYGAYRGGQTLDEEKRLQLREERLRIDKERVSRGEATIGKHVVSQSQEIDVPLIREELFVERRPVSNASAAADTTPIGNDSEVIRVPLTEERLNVSKTAYVTEEVVVGKRQVEETGHVSETTRREELDVNDVDTTVGTANRSKLDDARI